MKKIPLIIAAMAAIVALATGARASQNIATQGCAAMGAEVARLSALPPISVSMERVTVKAALAEIASKSGIKLMVDELPQIVDLHMTATPLALLNGMVQMNWFTLNYAGDGVWAVHSPTASVANTYPLRYVVPALGAGEPAEVTELKRVLRESAAGTGCSLEKIEYNADCNAVLVIAPSLLQGVAENFIAAVDHPKAQSAFTVGIRGVEARLIGFDGDELVMNNVSGSFPTYEERPAATAGTKEWARREVKAGTVISLQRIGEVTHYRIKSSRVVGWKQTGSVINPLIDEEEFSGGFTGDHAVVTVPEKKVCIAHRFLCFRWSNVKTFPALDVSIRRTSVVAATSKLALGNIPLFGMLFAE